MPATITISGTKPRTYALHEFMQALPVPAGSVVIDSVDQTFLVVRRGRGMSRSKFVSITPRGEAEGVMSSSVQFPVRLAPADHVVTFSN